MHRFRKTIKFEVERTLLSTVDWWLRGSCIDWLFKNRILSDIEKVRITMHANRLNMEYVLGSWRNLPISRINFWILRSLGCRTCACPNIRACCVYLTTWSDSPCSVWSWFQHWENYSCWNQLSARDEAEYELGIRGTFQRLRCSLYITICMYVLELAQRGLCWACLLALNNSMYVIKSLEPMWRWI